MPAESISQNMINNKTSTILVAHHAYFPGEVAHNRQIASMLEAIVDLGQEVSCILPRTQGIRTGAEVLRHLVDSYNVRAKFHLRLVPVLPFRHRKARGIVKLYDFLALRINSILFTFHVLFSQELKRAQIIYTRHLLLAYVLSYLPGVPERVVTELHDIPNSKASSIKLKRVLRSSMTVGVISAGIADALKGKGLSSHNTKTILVPDAVSSRFAASMTDRRSSREALGISQAGMIVTYCGSLYPFCSPEAVVKALTDFNSGEFIGWIVGGYPEQIVALKRLAKAHLDKIYFWGTQPHLRIPLFLSASDILVVSYAAWHARAAELSSPLKIYEYIAARRPIVAPKLPSVREVLTHGETGLLFTPDSAESMADCIKTLIRDPGYGARLAGNAAKQIGNWTWTERARRLFNDIDRGKV